MSSAPANSTSAPANSTSAPANSTSAPANSTSAPANSASVSANSASASADSISVPKNSSTQKTGFFGAHGGAFVSEKIQKRLDAITKEYEKAKNDPTFAQELQYYLTNYSGRETPLFFCKNLTEQYKGAKIYLKREDLNHLGAHKINNALGQVLLAKRMGITKLICETGAGQHGVATAAAAALFNLSCIVYMGEEDVKRQQPNVFRMRLMGATVRPVLKGQRTLKEAVDAAFDAFATDEDTFYIIGSAVGPHPYPTIVRDLQSVIGSEAKKQCLAQEGRLPDICMACIGGGSNAIGLFHPFINHKDVQLIGVEPGGIGTKLGEHAASLNYGKPGVLHGSSAYVLEDEKGETALVHSISAGLDYPGSGPEHGFLKDSNRATYVTVTDDEAVAAFAELSRHEGIIPALESSHALAHAFKIAPALSKDTIMIVSLSGRGDKDIPQLQKHFAL